jgi:hypothetical protein
MHGATGIARIVDASGETVGDFEPLLDLAQNQQTAVGRQAAIEAGDNLFALDRSGSGRVGSTMASGRSGNDVDWLQQPKGEGDRPQH